ncbi:MAG: hypothetical protein ACKPKO_06625, partial [Candidatus Fonsibacter sp.]
YVGLYKGDTIGYADGIPLQLGTTEDDNPRKATNGFHMTAWAAQSVYTSPARYQCGPCIPLATA